MKIYIDEDSINAIFVNLLRQAGHDLVLPSEILMLGKPDPVQLTLAIREQRVFLTHNHDDFRALHNLILVAGGEHPGMLIVRRINNPRRDLSPRGAALCLERFAASGLAIQNQFITLNDWRS